MHRAIPHLTHAREGWSDSSWLHGNMISRNTRSLSPAEQQAVPADLRLYHVDATADDGEFYVRCADLLAAADVVVQRASAKHQPVLYREIVEVTGGCETKLSRSTSSM